MGWLDGPLRLMPAWQVEVAGHPLAPSQQQGGIQSRRHPLE
jgi:hypothetical protein